MTYKDTIIVFRTTTCYVVDFVNTPLKHRTYRLYGTTVVPTNFTRDANPADVLKAVKASNPEYEVRIIP